MLAAIEDFIAAASGVEMTGPGAGGKGPWIAFVFASGNQVKFTGPDREAMAKEYRQFRKDLTFVRAQQPEKETP